MEVGKSLGNVEVEKSMRVIGVDGWKTKWIGIVIDENGFVEGKTFSNLIDVIAMGEYKVIALDVPIGLPDTPPREADEIVRQRVGERRASVFPVPPAFCLDSDWTDRAKASLESERLFGRGIGCQSFSLMANIRNAQEISVADDRVYEVHPEFCFYMMNDEVPLKFTKKSWNGQTERLQLLAKHGIEFPEMFECDVGRVPIDDILDAACSAWSAWRIANNECIAVPDRTKRSHRIWA